MLGFLCEPLYRCPPFPPPEYFLLAICGRANPRQDGWTQLAERYRMVWPKRLSRVNREMLAFKPVSNRGKITEPPHPFFIREPSPLVEGKTGRKLLHQLR